MPLESVPTETAGSNGSGLAEAALFCWADEIAGTASPAMQAAAKTAGKTLFVGFINFEIAVGGREFTRPLFRPTRQLPRGIARHTAPASLDRHLEHPEKRAANEDGESPARRGSDP